MPRLFGRNIHVLMAKSLPRSPSATKPTLNSTENLSCILALISIITSAIAKPPGRTYRHAARIPDTSRPERGGRPAQQAVPDIYCSRAPSRSVSCRSTAPDVGRRSQVHIQLVERYGQSVFGEGLVNLLIHVVIDVPVLGSVRPCPHGLSVRNCRPDCSVQ